jgi:hypothetical protein
MKTDEKMDDIFDFQPTQPIVIENETQEIVQANTEIVIHGDDFDTARLNIKELLKRGNTAIGDLLNVAKETEHPRAYEVAANFLKTLADLNKDLIGIQKTKMELEKKTNHHGENNTIIDKAVFVGSTTDLVKLIRSNK